MGGLASARRGSCTRPLLALLALAILSALLGPVSAAAQTLFGPQQYTLTTATPQTFSTLVSTSAGPAHLHVVNGAADGSARLSHASISVNGVEVVGPEDLGSDVAVVDRPVTLFANNVLSVTLTGPLGGTFEVTLERRGTSLASVTPASGRQGETLTVTVVGSNTHFAQGSTLLFAGRGISVGGAPAGAFGPVTVQDATHLTATLTLGPSIVLGPCLLLAKTNGERAALFPGVTVLAGTPAIAGTTVTTLAGTGTPGLVDGAGSVAQFRLPADIAPRADGSAVVADTGNSRLREVAPDGTTSTVALPVSLLLPAGVTLDAAGRTVIADTARCVIRIVNADGTVTTIGSAGSCTFADGPPGSARFRFPRDVAADAAGTLYVADTGNHRVRKIAPDGTVTTLAGTGAFGETDGPASSATFGFLTGIAVAEDPAGPPTILVSDAVFHRLRQIAPDGTVSPLAGTGVPGFADGPAAAAQLAFPTRLTRDPAGHLYLADTLNNLLRRLTPEGLVETLAGTGAWGSQDGPGTAATFTLPVGVGLAAASPSRVFVADSFSHKIRVLQAIPVITAISPASAVHGTTVSPFTVTGTNLLGATALTFLRDGTPDPAITATDLVVNPEGTTLTATVTLAATAALGPRTVTVTTPGGTSDAVPDNPATTFTVLGQLTLIPTFQELVLGATGTLTISLSAPAPPDGLPITLESANPAIATVTSPVTIAEGATSGTATVTGVSEGTTNLTASAPGFADGLAAVTVISPPPAITGFTPTSGKVRTAVTISGAHFRPSASENTVTFTGTNNTRVAAPVSAATTTSLTVTVPTGAITGPLQVTTPSGTATSSGHFVVLPSPDFTLTASPASTQAVPGSTVAVALQAVPRDGFTGLVTLSVSGLPAGATATFSPPTLGPSQGGTLSIATGTAASGSFPLTVTGTATIEGTSVSHSATVSLTILAAGQTSLVGRILDTAEQPVPGVTIQLGSLTTTTDAAGNFTLLDPPTGSQIVFLDGSTASSPDRSYPTIPVTVTITPGQVNTLPFQPHFHVQKARNFTDIGNSAVARTVTDPEVPGFSLTVPAGVTITGWDGAPNTQISVQPIPRDRLPLPPPPDGPPATSIYMFYFGKTGGGTPSAPVPVTVPNDIGALPGETLDLFYFDDSTPTQTNTNTWQVGGTGTVTADGKQIVTTSGGIRQFCCGGTFFRLRQALAAPSLPPPGASKRAVDPVDLATGLFVLENTDLVLPGRIPISLTRTYRTLDLSVGPFGLGSSHPYEVSLRPQGTDLFSLILPGNSRSLWSRGADGTFRNDQVPAYRSAAITLNPDGTRTLRWKDGSTWRFDPNGRLIAQADRNGNTVTISRDGQGRATAITEPAGRSLSLTYDGVSVRVSSVSDPLGRTVQYGYDTNGRLTQVTNPAGQITRYTYDASGRLFAITDPRGITFLTNEYDAAGRVVKQSQADAGVWTFAYTVTGGLVTQTVVTDPQGNATTYRFNTQGFLISQTDALGQTTAFERASGTNLLLSTTDSLGRVTRFTYDAQGNVTDITDPVGNSRSFTYDPTFNKVTSITDPLGNLTTFEYDAQGNLTAITDPEQSRRPEAERLKTRITYNAFGQPVSTTDPLGNATTFSYDAAGNLTVIADPLGNTTRRTYDLVSRLSTQTDPRGKITRFTYDGLNRLTQVVDALNGVTTFTYDPNGNLLTVSDPRGNTTIHTYDSMDRLSTRTDPLGRQESYQYDPNGNLTQFTDRKAQVSTFTRDALSRLTGSAFADGTFIEFAYDGVGRPVSVTDSQTGRILQEFDVLDRLIRETTPQGTIAYSYDAVGRRTTMTVGGQPPVTYSYDANSRLTQIVQNSQPVTIAYDALDRRTLLTLPGGVSTEYQYDPASRLTALIYRNATGVFGDLTYTYDPAGNRVAVGGSFAQTVLPDPVASTAYDAANQQLSFGNRTMTYDPNGNLVTLTDPSGTTTFTWDSRNQLTSLSGGPALAASFAYDAFGRRLEKTINGQWTAAQYDGVDIIQENSGGSEISYLRTLNLDEPLLRREGGAEHLYLLDGLASTVALSDSTGTPVTSYSYAPYGETRATGSVTTNPFQFTGRENDGTGLYYYRARYYAPQLARFISEDPLRPLNLYTYAASSPVLATDPLGLDTAIIVGGPGSSGVGPGGLGLSGQNVASIRLPLQIEGEQVQVFNSNETAAAFAYLQAAQANGRSANIACHSWGCGFTLRDLPASPNLQIDRLVTLDCVGLGVCGSVADNVRTNLNIYQTGGTPGIDRGSPNARPGGGTAGITNVDVTPLGLNHYDIPRDKPIQRAVAACILHGDCGGRGISGRK